MGKLQYQYLPELLVNVYRYHLMEKSVSCCCVCGREMFSKLVTHSQQWSKVANSGGGLISQQEKFSMVKIVSCGGLLK